MEVKNKVSNVRNLFVVDWKDVTDHEILRLLNSSGIDNYEWSVFNCQGKNYKEKGLKSRYISYTKAVAYIIKNKSKYDNIIIWQQMIGFMYCLLPRFNFNPKIIVATLLYSPGRLKPKSFRLYLLKTTLRRADALLYFSADMAENVRTVYPVFANKVFSTYLPIINNLDLGSSKFLGHNFEKKKNSVFTGGISDRDFETVIKAFSKTNVPVTIVCSKNQVFKNQELITDNFSIKRNVSETEYHLLVLSSSFIVIALEFEHSSCGQLLFTFGMKNQIPIIATDCFGTRDYISNNVNGVMVPLHDDRAIFNAYTRLISDNSFKEKIVENSTKIIEKMTFENFVLKIEDIIENIG